MKFVGDAAASAAVRADMKNSSSLAETLGSAYRYFTGSCRSTIVKSVSDTIYSTRDLLDHSNMETAEKEGENGYYIQYHSERKFI